MNGTIWLIPQSMAGTIITFPSRRELPTIWAAWRNGTIAGPEIADLYSVKDERRTAYYVLNNLKRKGWLRQHEHGWSPALSRAQACALLTEGTCY